MIPAELQWPDGLSTELFLQDYWQQRPVLLRQALPGFASPLSPDELGGLALDEDIHSRLVLRQRAEIPASTDVWHLRQGPFSEDDLTSLPAQDWTLLVSDIEKHLEGFSAYLEPFRFLPDWRIDDLMISYAPTGASAGAHIDEYDVFLLQAAGRRQWQISTDSSAPSTILPDQDLKILQQFEATDDWILQPGDVLYLPPGVPHHGIALDNDCMTWSIGFRAPLQHQLLTDITEHMLTATASSRYRDPALKPVNRKGELDQLTLDHLRRLWQQALQEDQSFEQAVGCVLTRRQDTLSDTPQSDRVGNLPVSGVLQRNSAARLLFRPSATSADLFVDGDCYSISTVLAESLCANTEWKTEFIRSLCANPEDLECLAALWRRGTLQL